MRQGLGMAPDQALASKPGQERVKALGEAARRLSHSQWALVVGEVTRDPDGAGFVWLGLGLPDGRWEIQRVPAQAGGETAHASLTTQLLERVRRRLLQETPAR
jgi:hypothetical protein